MVDALWLALDDVKNASYENLLSSVRYCSRMFDAAHYRLSDATLQSDGDAEEHWRKYGRQEGREFAPNAHTLLTIILKVKDENELIEKWIEHHSAVVGAHNIIVLNCGSEDPAFLRYLEYLKTQVLVFDYTAYYDYVHHVHEARPLYEAVAANSKYVCVLDADEFIFGVIEGMMHGSYVADILKNNDTDCFAGTWICNTLPPSQMEGAIDWSQPITFGLDPTTLRWWTRSGKAILRTKHIAAAGYVGHNYGDARLEQFLSPDSFGQIAILHVARLGDQIDRARALRHLKSKGLISTGATSPSRISEEVEEQLKRERLAPIERLYLEKYRNPKSTGYTPDTTFQSRLLSGSEPERFEVGNLWSQIYKKSPF